MSSETAIRVEGLAKRYRIGARQESFPTLRDRIARVATSPFRRLRSALRGESARLVDEEIWALRDVSFEIEPGEVVGVVGRNGAGKTTLLKVLSRITEPTAGRAEIRGRVGSLLEVGTGFHPELTGRENIFLNGAILGMTRIEIASKLDEIVAFAEIDRFLDTQVKHYSSGMYLRLAFSVAAHLEPEILLVDEVLAVGDAAFQRKCLGKMGEVADQGRTILFVSHSLDAVQRLCGRCLWMGQGTVRKDAFPSEVVSAYLSETASRRSHTYSAGGASEELVSLREAAVLDTAGASSPLVRFGEPFSIEMHWRHSAPTPGAYYFLRFFDQQGRLLFASNHSGTDLDSESAGDRHIHCRFEQNVLVPGDYTVTIGCFLPPKTMLALADECLGLTVLDVPFEGIRLDSPEKSVFCPRPEWSLAPNRGTARVQAPGRL